MTLKLTSPLPQPTPEQRRVAAGQFERANQVASTGNHDYGIQLLLTCCKLDPANLIYRRALRQTQRAKYRNNLRGSLLAFVTTLPARLRLKAARRAGDPARVLECAEQILNRNPWDLGAQIAIAEAFQSVNLPDHAIWCLEQAHLGNEKSVRLHQVLAELYEQRGNYTGAIAMWGLIRQINPRDAEVQQKIKDLHASSTIAKGNYEQVIHPAPIGTEPARKEEKPAAPAAQDPAATATAAAERVSREAAALEAKLKDEPSSPHLYLQLAGLYRHADQLDRAREVLARGLGATGNHFEVALALAELDVETFRRNLAVTEEKLRGQPGDAELTKLRAKLAREVNLRELDIYRQKADRYPTELGHRYEVGVRLLRAGQIDEAIASLQAARPDPRYHWRALVYLGYCFKHRNNWRLAQRNFEDALKQMPPAEEAMRKDVLFQLAHGAAEAGEFQKAVEIGYELANLDFAYRDIGRLLDEWQTKAQNAPATKS